MSTAEPVSVTADVMKVAYEAWSEAWEMAHGRKETGGNAVYLPIAAAIMAERLAALSHVQAPAPVAGIPTSLKTFQEAARDLAVKNGWKPGNNLSLHSVIQLMANFAMMVDRGEVGCDWPQCGCCADAVCEDAVATMSSSPTPQIDEAMVERGAIAGNVTDEKAREIIEAAIGGAKRSGAEEKK